MSVSVSLKILMVLCVLVIHNFVCFSDIQTAFNLFRGVTDLYFDNICSKQTFAINYLNKLPYNADLRKSTENKNPLQTKSKCNPKNTQLHNEYKLLSN